MLLHYAPAPITLDRGRAYTQRNWFKPQGFWISVGTAWADWCEGEEWGLACLLAKHVVTLEPRANLLRLTTPDQIDTFTERFHGSNLEYINWPAVSHQYQGILIAPYCWSRRLSPNTSWYYTWDCASGCIWDLTAIRAVQLQPHVTTTEGLYVRQ